MWGRERDKIQKMISKSKCHQLSYAISHNRPHDFSYNFIKGAAVAQILCEVWFSDSS